MSNMKFLNEEDIYTNLTYLQELNDETVQYDAPYDVAKYIEKFSSSFGLATYTLASAIYYYQTKKTPASVALRDWSKELCDKMDKRLNGLQSVLRIVSKEENTSRFQPS